MKSLAVVTMGKVECHALYVLVLRNTSNDVVVKSVLVAHVHVKIV